MFLSITSMAVRAFAILGATLLPALAIGDGHSIPATSVATAAEDSHAPTPQSKSVVAVLQPLPGEDHLGTIYQLTDGGENAEAYFSQDGQRLIYQSTPSHDACDQIHMMYIDGSDKHLVSTGKGRTTCSFIVGNNEYITYSSTHHISPDCPPRPEAKGGYSWFLYHYDIFRAGMDGSNPVDLTNSDSYNAEATVSPDGRHIAFSSTRSGDQEIFIMDADGGNVRQITNQLGYDGGPFYNWDGTKIVFRSHRPQTPEEIAYYKKAVQEGVMLRVPLELYIMDADGTNEKQLTHLGAASFAPFMHPDNKRIIFCSNYGDKPWVFNLWMINVDGSGLKRITTSDRFDGFPMFSRDGKYLVFCSDRNAKVEGNTNIFITKWQE